MQDPEKIREIQELGWENSPDPEEPKSGGTGGSWVPVLQAVVCLLILGGLLLLKNTGQPVYDTITAWYHQEAQAEIQLPQWSEEDSQPSSSPAPSLAPSPTPDGPGLLETDASLQRL